MNRSGVEAEVATGGPALINRQTARRRWEAKQQARLARFEEAWKVARQLAEMLGAEFGATRVVAFGSLVHHDRFGLASDIDLAAWGIDGAPFYAAVARCQDLSGAFKVDLVDPLTCRESLRDEIAREGVVLWSHRT